MPKPPTIIGEIRNWNWLDEKTAIVGKIFSYKEPEVLPDGRNVVIKVKYRSNYDFSDRPYWLIAGTYTSDGERFQMFYDEEKK